MKISVRQRPFAPTVDPRFVYREGSYAQVMSDVTDGLRRREELILVTGAPGTGKSTLCNDVLLLSRLDRSVFPSMVSDPWVSVEEIVGHILRDCGMPAPAGVTRHDLVNALRRFLTSLSAQGAHVLLIVDEAQHLRPEVIEQLRLVSSGDKGGEPVLQILMVGQPELEKLFESPHLDQRVARRCSLKCLDGDETKRYIQHRLHAADVKSATPHEPLLFGASPEEPPPDRFSPAAVREIAVLSSGALRAIDMICDRSLELASQRNIAQVDRPLVREVARQMKIPTRSLGHSRAGGAMVATALVAGLPPIAWFWVSQAHPHGQSSATASVVQAAPADPFEVGALSVVPAVSVEVGSFAAESRAAGVAAQLSEGGLPASSRPNITGSSHLVLVGPYVTDEEARGAQSAVVGQGFDGARILHQQTLAPGSLDARASNDGFPRILAITPGGKRASLAFELVGPPVKVTTQRVSASSLEVEIGPVAGSIRQQDLAGNGAVPLVDRVSLRSFVAPDGKRSVRVRVNMTEAARSQVRMVGRRVYVDLSSSEDAAETVSSQGAPASEPRDRIDIAPQQRASDAYRQAVGAAAARFDEIQPFLLSSLSDPSPDVLQAVGATIAEVRGLVEHVKVPPSAAQDHALLLSGLAAASTAVQPDFAGDRAAKAREAIAAFQVVKAQPSSPLAGRDLLAADGRGRTR